MDTKSAMNEQQRRPGAAREWYAAHRADVVARLAEPTACGSRKHRSAELLVLAFDDDPAIVGRARVARGAGL